MRRDRLSHLNRWGGRTDFAAWLSQHKAPEKECGVQSGEISNGNDRCVLGQLNFLHKEILPEK